MMTSQHQPLLILLSLLLLESILLLQPVLALTGPGSRNSACAFSYNNIFYVIGGVMDSTQNYSVFASTPVSELSGTTVNWTKLPDPPQWKSLTSYYPSSQFDCAATSDGKVFLFGNEIGFAQYDIQSAKWDDTPPKFTSTGVSMKNLVNQQGLRATVNIDRTSIVIVSTSPPTFMRLNPQTKEISGTSIYTIISGLRGFCLGIIQKNPEQVILCGGSYYHQESNCYELVTQSTSVYTNSFNSLPSSQEGCSIVSHDAGYFVNQGLMSSNANAPSWTDSNSGSSSSVFYSMQNGLWTEYHNSLSNSYPLRGYSAATYIPNMKMAVIYGGVLPGQNTSSEIYTLNLTDTISSYKGDSGSSGSSGFSLVGLLVKIFGSLVAIGVVLGILKSCCCRVEEQPVMVQTAPLNGITVVQSTHVVVK